MTIPPPACPIRFDVLPGKRPVQQNVISREHGERCSGVGERLAALKPGNPVPLIISSGGPTLQGSVSEAELGARRLQEFLNARGIRYWRTLTRAACLQEAKGTGRFPTRSVVLEDQALTARMNGVLAAELIAQLCTAVGWDPQRVPAEGTWVSQAYLCERIQVRGSIVPERSDAFLMGEVLPGLTLCFHEVPYAPLASPDPHVVLFARVYTTIELAFDALHSNLSGLKQGQAPGELRRAAVERAYRGWEDLCGIQRALPTITAQPETSCRIARFRTHPFPSPGALRRWPGRSSGGSRDRRRTGRSRRTAPSRSDRRPQVCGTSSGVPLCAPRRSASW